MVPVAVSALFTKVRLRAMRKTKLTGAAFPEAKTHVIKGSRTRSLQVSGQTALLCDVARTYERGSQLRAIVS